MATDEIVHVVLIALAWAAPVVAIGAAILIRARISLLTSTVLMVLIPLIATFAGVFGVSGLMFTGDLKRTTVVLAAVAVITIPAGFALGRFQARRTVWERQMRAKERVAEQSRRELVAWVSHDLRTPLADVKALAEALADHVVTDPDEVESFARQIDRNTVRLAQMVDDLFEMSRINAGALTLTLEPVDLREVADEVVTATRAAADRATVTLTMAAPGTEIVVNGNPPALSRTLTNLVVNAIAHTPPGGTVEVRVGVDAARAWVHVQDNGVGIAEADLPRIFDVSYRGTVSRTPVNGTGLPVGSGMGLAIARGLVDAHAGTIDVVNTGEGSRFEIALPIAH